MRNCGGNNASHNGWRLCYIFSIYDLIFAFPRNSSLRYLEDQEYYFLIKKQHQKKNICSIPEDKKNWNYWTRISIWFHHFRVWQWGTKMFVRIILSRYWGIVFYALFSYFNKKQSPRYFCGSIRLFALFILENTLGIDSF